LSHAAFEVKVVTAISLQHCVGNAQTKPFCRSNRARLATSGPRDDGLRPLLIARSSRGIAISSSIQFLHHTGSIQAEGMGFEPTIDFDATGDLSCRCVICQECRAANALHSGCLTWLELASRDTDLRRVIDAWEKLPAAIRRAIVTLVSAINPDGSGSSSERS
jgi:hypothetical protein